jgi:hypothetical protein
MGSIYFNIWLTHIYLVGSDISVEISFDRTVND